MRLTSSTESAAVGAKERGGASEQAALELQASGRAQLLRQRVADYFAAGHQATADEVAAALGESILSIRPRVSELRTSGLIVATDTRRRSVGGRWATVWKLWPKA